MFLSPRRRRPSYSSGVTYAEPQRNWVGTVIRLVIILVVIYFLGLLIVRLFSGGSVERASALLQTEEGSNVSVSLEGESFQRAENGVKLYAGDTVRTEGSSQASLVFFDRSVVSMDGTTTVHITKSNNGESDGEIAVEVQGGTVWMETPTSASFTGSVVRTVKAPTFTFTIPSRAKVLMTTTSVAVFSADGLGVTVSANGKTDVYIGEGQKWVATNVADLPNDLYALRSPLDDTLKTSAFVQKHLAGTMGSAVSTNTPTGLEKVIVSKPKENDIVTTPTVTVEGSASADVTRVTINGYDAQYDTTRHSFTQELSISDAETTTFHIQGMNAEGDIIAEVNRTIRREVAALAAPTIESPAKAGQTYRTQAEELIIRGNAPPGATGISVNGYVLKLFTPEKGTWSYVASTKSGNLKAGTNTYDVVALYGDALSSQKSDAARVTILWEEGTVGVVTGTTTPVAGTSSSAKPVVDPTTLPKNDPTDPGTLKVTAPVAGTEATITGTGTLIEGTTSNKTASVWVNDYQLQLYKPGVTTWNYIAAVEYKNLKTGANEYTIIARDADGKIIDTLVYKITLE